MSLSHLSILSSPFYLFSPFSPLHSFSLCPFPSLFFPSLTSLPSYPFSLSIHSPPSSLPLLSSTFSYLPSLTFFSLLSPPHSFLSFQLSLSPILSVLSHLSLLYIFLLSHSSPFSSLPSLLSLSLLSSLHSFFRYPLPSVYLIIIFSPLFCPFSSPFSLFSLLSPLPFSSTFPHLCILYPLSLSLSTPFCVSSSFSYLSLSPLSNFSPFSLLSSPLFTVFCLSPLYPLLSSFSPFSLLPFSLLFLSISFPLCPFSPISFLLSSLFHFSLLSPISSSLSCSFSQFSISSIPSFPLSIISLISSLNSLSSLPLSLLQYLCLPRWVGG